MLKIKTYLLLFSVLFFFFPFISFAQNNFDYRVMEGIPGVIQHGQVYTFNQYISAVYSFAIWAVGIAALLMISIGAFMYLTSAGNNAAMSSAKGVITDALIGLVLAMLSWLLLYIINPDLVSPSGITGNTGTLITPTRRGNTPTPSVIYRRLNIDPNNPSVINFSQANTDPTIRTSRRCDNYNFNNNSGGVDPAILKTIAHLESSCGANKGESSAHACGLMQLKPSTATRLNNNVPVTCNDLINNDQLSIDLASKYIAQNQNSAGVQAAQPQNRTAAIFAGYNSGYSTAPGTSASGRTPALAPSKDCPGARAFECSRNPGGLTESINYAYNGTGLYTRYRNAR